MTSVLVVAALKPELSPLRRQISFPGVHFLQSGVGPDRARQVLLAAPAADLLLSTGCCGGLISGLGQGELILASEVSRLTGDRVNKAPGPDPRLLDQMHAALEGCATEYRLGGLVTSEQALRTPDQKRAAAEISGALAVDMETCALAEVAASRKIPYLSLRVVLDPVSETLPVAPDPGAGPRSPFARSGRADLAGVLGAVQIAAFRRRLGRIAPLLIPGIKAFCRSVADSR